MYKRQDLILCGNNIFLGSCDIEHSHSLSSINNFESGEIWADTDLQGSDCSSNPIPTINNLGGLINFSCNTAPNFELPSINCSPNFVGTNQLTGQLDESDFFETDGIIVSDHIIGSTTDANIIVEYDSGISIELLKNFEVTDGVIFIATIDGCDE